MPVPEGCEASLKATPTVAQGAEAAKSPAWQFGDRVGSVDLALGSPLLIRLSRAPWMNVGAELEGSREEGAPRAQVSTRQGWGPAGHPAANGRGQASEGAAGSSPSLATASPFIPFQASWLWGQRTLELEQAVTALSQAPHAPFPHSQGLRHHSSTGADPLHGVWPFDNVGEGQEDIWQPQVSPKHQHRLCQAAGRHRARGAGCMGSNPRLINPQPQAWQHQGDGRLVGPPLHQGDRDGIQLSRDGAAADSPYPRTSGRGCPVAIQPGGRQCPDALCLSGGGSCHVRGCSGSHLLPPPSTLAFKSHLSQPVWPQEVGSGTGDHPVSTSFVTEVV